jgi:hypothetical protein
MAAGTLLVLDASLPGGLIEGSGTIAYGQTMAFTTLVIFQLFNVFNARSDDLGAFHGLFRNGWLWGDGGAFAPAARAGDLYALPPGSILDGQLERRGLAVLCGW